MEIKIMALKLTSSAYQNEEKIPSRYTCDGDNISPPLQWSNVPQGIKSFALIFEDPDAPAKTWVHWLLYNIPADQRKLEEHIPSTDILANGAVHGINDFKKKDYRGPCPPGDTHRYFMKLYALDNELDLGPGATKTELLGAIEGHIMEEAELMGEYTRR